MKKYGIGWMILDIILFLWSLLGVVTGNADPFDYGLVIFALLVLVIFIIRAVYIEIQVQKKLKEMRENEKRGAGT